MIISFAIKSRRKRLSGRLHNKESNDNHLKGEPEFRNVILYLKYAVLAQSQRLGNVDVSRNEYLERTLSNKLTNSNLIP